MLVLGRKQGEKIVIADDIVITVTLVDRHRVKLGIEAPREIPVHREEIHKKIKARETALSKLTSA